MYSQYFYDEENVRADFRKRFISLWPGWLGKENHHKLDEVTKEDWERFNHFLELVGERFQFVVCEEKKLVPLLNVDSILFSYEEYLQKEPTQFHTLVIPELGCVISEDWDYTFIIWHKDSNATSVLEPYVQAARLCSFS